MSPLDEIAENELLSAHMLQHVILGDLAPALAVVALRGPLLFFVLPKAALRALARLGGLRTLLSLLLHPLGSFGFWVGALALWHLPPAYDFALRHPLAHDAEHASFVVGGVLVWSQLVDPARRRVLGTTGRLLFLLAVFACGQALATTLVAAPDPIYASYAHKGHGRFGLSPSADQDYAGFVMMAEQLLTLGTCAALLLRRHLRQLEAPDEGARHPLTL